MALKQKITSVNLRKAPSSKYRFFSRAYNSTTLKTCFTLLILLRFGMSTLKKKFYTFILLLFTLQILPAHASTLSDFKVQSGHIQNNRAGILFSYDILFDNPSEESVDSFSICVRIKKNTECQLHARFQGENSKHVEHFFPYGSIASQSGTQSFSIFLDKLIFGRQGQDSAQKIQTKVPLYEATLSVPNLYRVAYNIKSLTFLNLFPS